MTYQEAYNYLLGNPMRDPAKCKAAIEKIRSTKSANAQARRLADEYTATLHDKLAEEAQRK